MKMVVPVLFRQRKADNGSEEQKEFTMNRKTVLCVLALVVAHTAFAQQYDSALDFTVRATDGGKSVEITRYAGNNQTVNIPPRIEGLPVTKIGDEAFQANDRITSITIPAGVTSIGNRVFDECVNLETVTFAEGSQLKIIGDGVFVYCYKLANITIPANVTTIGNRAFTESGLTSITISASVTSIGANAFEYCGRLRTVTFAANSQLKNISQSAFVGCERLTDINLPAGVTKIDNYAFAGCVRLTFITIPASVTSIGRGAFAAWRNTQTIIVRGPTINWNREWREECGAQLVDQRADASFPSGFAGTWKRDNFNNTLTLTQNTLKSSSQDYTWTLIGVSGDSYIHRTDNYTTAITIKLVNGNLEISGDSGTSENNWNGTWKK